MDNKPTPAATTELTESSELCRMLIGQSFPEPVAKHFPRRIFWQLVYELNSARVFVRRDAVFDEVLQFPCELGTSSEISAQHDERFWCVKLGILPVRNHGRLQNTGVFDQGTLDFRGRHPLARNPKHIVGTPCIPIVAVGIHAILVAR